MSDSILAACCSWHHPWVFLVRFITVLYLLLVVPNRFNSYQFPICKSKNRGLGAADAVDMRTILRELDAKHAQNKEGADAAAWQASTWPREFTKPLEWLVLKHQPSLWMNCCGRHCFFVSVCVRACVCTRVCCCLPRVWCVPLHILIYLSISNMFIYSYMMLRLCFQESFCWLHAKCSDSRSRDCTRMHIPYEC